MTQLRKYAFALEFSPDGKILRETASRLSPEQLEAECARAYERGKQDSSTQAEREAAAALERIAAAASAILARLDGESRLLREQAAGVAIAAARKIAGAALDKFGAESIAAAIEAAIDTLRHQPRLIIKLAPEAAEALAPRIEQMRAAHAYAGALLVRPEPARGPGEVELDWSDAVIGVDPRAIAARIDELVEAALHASAPTTEAGAAP